MDRRTFIIMCASTGGIGLPPFGRLSSGDPFTKTHVPPDIFPQFPPVKSLRVAPLHDVNLAERHLYTTFQGLINRKQPRVYYVLGEIDEIWLNYYRDQYAIPHSRAENPAELLEEFTDEIEGYVVYDPENPDTRNVASLLGGLRQALPVHPQLEIRLKNLGLSKIDDLRGRWSNRYEAYRWAFNKLFSDGNRRILGMNCVDEPHWPSQSLWVDDYFIANNVFIFDLSAARRDREDRRLLDDVFAAAEAPGCLMGWRSARNTEHEIVGFAARRGFFVLSALHIANLSVHSAIPTPTRPFQQRHRSPSETGPVEKKIYVALMNTDGDALASMLQLQAGRFHEPEHGRLPYSWGVLPLAYDLMPGVAQHNQDLKLDNDYFVAATCGAAYTYPHLLPETREYLRYTRHYMEKTDLRVAYMANWDDDWWWQEMETPGFLETLREELPEAIGFLRGMGESAFEPHIINGGAPYIFCGEGIHRDSDIYTTITEFVEANSIRPLFIFLLVNHTTTLERIVKTVDRLPKQHYEFVRLDSFFHLVQKAQQEGLIENDLYPDKTRLRRLLAKEAKAAWPKRLELIQEHSHRANLSEPAFRLEMKDPMVRLLLDRTAATPADIVAFDAVWDVMHLVRLALNIQGVYVNNKAKGVRDFMAAFGPFDDAAVVEEVWRAWEKWEESPIDYEKAADWARRIARLAKALDSGVASYQLEDFPEPSSGRFGKIFQLI